MSSSVETCCVCHRLRRSGSSDQDGDVFICDQCATDADRLFEIQDATWPRAVVAVESTDKASESAQP